MKDQILFCTKVRRWGEGHHPVRLFKGIPLKNRTGYSTLILKLLKPQP